MFRIAAVPHQLSLRRYYVIFFHCNSAFLCFHQRLSYQYNDVCIVLRDKAKWLIFAIVNGMQCSAAYLMNQFVDMNLITMSSRCAIDWDDGTKWQDVYWRDFIALKMDIQRIMLERDEGDFNTETNIIRKTIET